MSKKNPFANYFTRQVNIRILGRVSELRICYHRPNINHCSGDDKLDSLSSFKSNYSNINNNNNNVVKKDVSTKEVEGKGEEEESPEKVPFIQLFRFATTR